MTFIEEKIAKFEKYYASESNEYMGKNWNIAKEELKNFLRQALEQQKEEIIEKLPKKEQPKPFESESDFFGDGYNQALSEVKEIIKNI